MNEPSKPPLTSFGWFTGGSAFLIVALGSLFFFFSLCQMAWNWLHDDIGVHPIVLTIVVGGAAWMWRKRAKASGSDLVDWKTLCVGLIAAFVIVKTMGILIPWLWWNPIGILLAGVCLYMFVRY